MTNPFAALNTATTGLAVQQRLAELAGKNVANANTDGYSRNVADLTEDTLTSGAQVFSVRTDIGGGVAISDVTRARDELSESRSLVENASGSYLNELNNTYSNIEGIITEPSDNGFGEQLNDFWNTWDKVANTPSSEGARTALLAQGQTVTDTLNHTSASLTQLATQTASAAIAAVGQVNSTLTQIAQLNQKLLGTSVSGDGALNDVMDQRDLLVEQVAQATGATRNVDAEGNVNLSINGIQVVAGNLAIPLTAVASPTNAVTITDPQGNVVNMTGGKIGAMVASTNTIYPGQVAQLDAVAQQLWTDVNALHTTGYGLNADAATTGRNFFDPPSTPPGVTAATIRISAQVANNPDAVSVANTANSTDGAVARAIANLQSSLTGASAVYQQVVAQLGVHSAANQTAAKVQAGVVSQVETARKSVSGVSVDEEMVNITQAQNAYAANAKVISVIDEMLQTLMAIAT